MMAARSAMSLFRLIGFPSPSMTADRSTSVSKMTPRSAFAATVARTALSMACASSGLGEWFGKLPSGSRNCEPLVSAPSGFNTLSAKNPPLPLPASTMIFMPVRGFSGVSGCAAPFLMSSRSVAA